MGMYDTVIAKATCPCCGHSDEFWFQTKAFECMLDVIREGEDATEFASMTDGSFECHEICPSCDEYVQGEAIVKGGILTGVELKGKGLPFTTFVEDNSGKKPHGMFSSEPLGESFIC